MSSSSSASEPLPLRPHHALCIGFFEGKGYSERFVRHMADVIARLGADDPLLKLVTECDCICTACPHNCGSICESAQKVMRYDVNVLTLCGLQAGAVLHWTELRETVGEMILRRGRLSEVCGGCRWETICCGKGGRA